MDHEERGQQEAERVLDGFPERHAQRAPLVEQPEREQAVHGDRAVERERARAAAPQREEPPAPARHRVERHEPEGVVGEVEGQVEEQDVRRPEPQAAYDDHTFGTLLSASSTFAAGYS